MTTPVLAPTVKSVEGTATNVKDPPVESNAVTVVRMVPEELQIIRQQCRGDSCTKIWCGFQSKTPIHDYYRDAQM